MDYASPIIRFRMPISPPPPRTRKEMPDIFHDSDSEAKMELEIGLKITRRTTSGITSTADLRIAKDKSGIIFLSNETETAFILTAHLKGYGPDDIDIAINEDGSQITVCGNITVEEKVMRGWMMHKEEVKLNKFQKVFLIPKGVVLNKIKAKFEEDKSTLVIFMPKSVKGMSSQKIEEIKETRDDAKRERHQMDHESVGERKGGDQLEQAIEREMIRSNLEKQLPNEKREKEKEEDEPKTMDETPDKSDEEEIRQREKPEFLPPTSICGEPYHEVQSEEGEFQGSKSKLRQENIGGNVHGNQSRHSERIADSLSSKPTVDDNKLHLEQHEGDETHDQDQQGENTDDASPNQLPQPVGDYNNNAKPSRKRWNKCKLSDPAIVGPVLLVSLLIIVAQLIRTKRK